MDKPVFDYRAHKIMWAILAETGWRFKFHALEKMKEVPYPLVNDCFACSAQAELLEVQGICRKGLCPLDWGDGTDVEHPCELLHNGCKGGLYYEWCSSDPEDTEQRKALAAEIRDLPLSKNARKLYTIID